MSKKEEIYYQGYWWKPMDIELKSGHLFPGEGDGYFLTTFINDMAYYRRYNPNQIFKPVDNK